MNRTLRKIWHARENGKWSKLGGIFAVMWSAALTGGAHVDGAEFLVTFEGIISTQGSFEDPSGLFTPGQTITGFWKLSTTTIDADADPLRGEYPHAGTPAFRIDIGAHSFTSDAITIQILNDFTTGIGTIDAYDVLGGAAAVSTVPLLDVNAFQITLRDTELPLNALANDLLPAVAPNPSNFDQIGQAAGQITGNILRGGQFFLNLEIRSTDLVVPEPACALLAATWAAVVILRRRSTPG